MIAIISVHFVPAMTMGYVSVSPNSEGADVEWSIPDFFSLGDCYHWSPDFSFGGHLWYFRMNLNNRRSNNSSEPIKLVLCRISHGPSTRIEFSVSLKTMDGHKEHEVHCVEIFEKSQLHVIHLFEPSLELSKRRSELVPHDVLTLLCTMKNPKAAENNNKLLMGIVIIVMAFVAGYVSAYSRMSYSSSHTYEDAESLCEVYKKMLLSGRHHDLILKVGGKELRAHRDILRARSRVFESMIDHDMKEKNSAIIDVYDCDPHAMELFLTYVYCGRMEALDHSYMLELYKIADKYEMIDLRRECHDFIKKSLSLTNICSVIQLALNHSDSELLEHATKYFADNVLDILQTVEWQSFLKNNSAVGNELLMKFIKKLKNA